VEGAADHTKIFFHTTQYAQYRPNVLGSSLAEQMLRITMDKPIGFQLIYTPSIRLKIPKWLNLAIGYGANGMLTGNGENNGLF
jgi:hypothetical protein